MTAQARAGRAPRVLAAAEPAPVPLAMLSPAQRRLVLALIEAGRATQPSPESHTKAAASVRMTAAAVPEVRGHVAAPAP